MQVCDRCESPKWRVEELEQRLRGCRQIIELVNHHLCEECYGLYLEWCAARTPQEDALAEGRRLLTESKTAQFAEAEVYP